jgi:hypothetical protein
LVSVGMALFFLGRHQILYKFTGLAHGFNRL